MKRSCITIVFLALFALADVALGSGTYRPPHPPNQIGSVLRSFFGVVSKEQVKRGKALFEGNSLVGQGGQTCASCHGRGKAGALKRSSLRKQTKELANLINVCLTDQSRSAGQTLEFGSPKLIELGAFVIMSYRLKLQDIKYLRSDRK